MPKASGSVRTGPGSRLIVCSCPSAPGPEGPPSNLAVLDQQGERFQVQIWAIQRRARPAGHRSCCRSRRRSASSPPAAARPGLAAGRAGRAVGVELSGPPGRSRPRAPATSSARTHRRRERRQVAHRLPAPGGRRGLAPAAAHLAERMKPARRRRAPRPRPRPPGRPVGGNSWSASSIASLGSWPTRGSRGNCPAAAAAPRHRRPRRAARRCRRGTPR